MSAPAFTEKDVAKAVAGAKAAGFTVRRIDVNRHTGLISLYEGGETAEPEPADEIANWMTENGDDRPQGPSPRKR